MADQGRMVQVWFQKAAQDLKTAKLLLNHADQDFLGSIVFHAQQAAEKSIKGFLAYKQIRFSKTHDIAVLLQLVAPFDAELANSLQPSIILSKFAVAYRYPEEAELPESLTRQVAEKATVLANWVFEELKALAIRNV